MGHLFVDHNVPSLDIKQNSFFCYSFDYARVTVSCVFLLFVIMMVKI